MFAFRWLTTLLFASIAQAQFGNDWRHHHVVTKTTTKTIRIAATTKWMTLHDSPTVYRTKWQILTEYRTRTIYQQQQGRIITVHAPANGPNGNLNGLNAGQATITVTKTYTPQVQHVPNLIPDVPTEAVTHTVFNNAICVPITSIITASPIRITVFTQTSQINQQSIQRTTISLPASTISIRGPTVTLSGSCDVRSNANGPLNEVLSTIISYVTLSGSPANGILAQPTTVIRTITQQAQGGGGRGVQTVTITASPGVLQQPAAVITTILAPGTTIISTVSAEALAAATTTIFLPATTIISTVSLNAPLALATATVLSISTVSASCSQVANGIQQGVQNGAVQGAVSTVTIVSTAGFNIGGNGQTRTVTVRILRRLSFSFLLLGHCGSVLRCA